jgi:DNA-directed RNA polymerase subunit RPC12/RpoP
MYQPTLSVQQGALGGMQLPSLLQPPFAMAPPQMLGGWAYPTYPTFSTGTMPQLLAFSSATPANSGATAVSIMPLFAPMGLAGAGQAGFGSLADTLWPSAIPVPTASSAAMSRAASPAQFSQEVAAPTSRPVSRVSESSSPTIVAPLGEDDPLKSVYQDQVRKRQEQQAQARKTRRRTSSKRAGDRRYTCGECKRAFSCSSNLKRHQVLHSGEKPYACQHCGACFSNSSNRRKHEQTHERHAAARQAMLSRGAEDPETAAAAAAAAAGEAASTPSAAGASGNADGRSTGSPGSNMSISNASPGGSNISSDDEDDDDECMEVDGGTPKPPVAPSFLTTVTVTTTASTSSTPIMREEGQLIQLLQPYVIDCPTQFLASVFGRQTTQETFPARSVSCAVEAASSAKHERGASESSTSSSGEVGGYAP